MTAPRLAIEGVTKTFPGVTALDGVSFSVAGGSVHALCGENGAGKSTLLKVLSGAHKPDAGRVLLDGRPFHPATTADALRAGVAVIYQELQLVDDLSVAENVSLGHFPVRAGLIDRRRLEARAREALGALGVDIDPNARLGDLPIALRQTVEIAKALTWDARVLALDEPTSSLSARETDALFTLVRRLRDDGRAVVYITHRLAEVREVCDAVTVLRDGRHVRTSDRLTDVTDDQIVLDMVGREVGEVFPYRPRPLGETALQVRGLTGPGLAAPVNLSVRQGEIVGVFGLVGSGRTELLKALFGWGRGEVEVGGRPVSLRSPAEAIAAGIGLCPEDRKAEGIVAGASVTENVSLVGPRGFWVDDRAERARAQTLVDLLRVRTPSLDQPIGLLSGGNQQKAVLARWLDRGLELLLLDEPTRGVDVGAKAEVYRIVHSLAEAGTAVLLVSGEIAEVRGVADRVLVMSEGRLVADVDRAEATEERLMRLALPAEPTAGNAQPGSLRMEPDQ